MVIREASVHDVPSLQFLCTELGYPCSSEEILVRIENLVSRTDHAIFITTDASNNITAWIHLFETYRLESPPFAEIGGFIVHPDHRRMGIAARMIEHARQWTKARGLDKLCVRCNAERVDGNRFYESAGFQLNKIQKVWHLIL